MSLSNLKKQSKNFDHLVEALEKLDKPTYDDSDTTNFWKPEPDKAGNALAIIRFLPGPAVDGDDALPWVRYWDHGFQNPTSGKWYIEKSLTTLNQKDPVSEFNTQLWNSTTDEDSPERRQARDQKRRLHYVSNILVIDDPKNPENNGKVKLFRYGKKIMDKIEKMWKPDLPTEPKINPFDFWKGAPFKLKVTRQMVKQGKRSVPMPNYDEACFLTPAPIFDNDEEIEKIWNSEFSLKELVDPKNFKSYDELKAKLDDVLGLNVSRGAKATRNIEEEIPFENSRPIKKPPVEETTEEEDDDLAMFRRLAQE